MNVETKTIDINTVNLNPDNPRTISTRDMDLLVKSLTEFPEMLKLRELVVDENMTVIGGNMRLLALRKTGAHEVTAKIVKGLTEAQKREFVIKDNSSFGQWDFDALANSWSDLPLEDWGLKIPEEPDSDDDPVTEDNFDADAEAEKIEVPITEKGNVWILGRHRLLCGDSTHGKDIEKLMAGGIADMICPDPPYGVDYTDKNDYLNKKRSGTGHRKIAGDELRKDGLGDFLDKAFIAASKHLRPGGCVYVAYADINTAQFRQALKAAGIKISQTIIWVKNSAVLSRNDYNWRHEPILYGWKEGAGHYFCRDFTLNTVFDDQIDPLKMTKAELVAALIEMKKIIPETIIRENRPTKNDLHPTMKPINLVARMIKNSTNHAKKEIVLDTFGGSGTTLMAAEQIGRTAYLCELDERYCDVIKLRWEQFTGKEGLLENGK